MRCWCGYLPGASSRLFAHALADATAIPKPHHLLPLKIQAAPYRAMLSIRGTSHGPVSVCPSQVGVLLKQINESSWFLACELPSTRSYTVLKGNSVISKNKGTSIWNFVLNSGLRNFRHSITIVETCYQLSSRKVDVHSVINWAVVSQLSQ